ncbi:hypothetical protein D3C77_474420 [compost metagenome]
MTALQIGSIEVEPASLIEVATAGRAVAVVVVTLSVELRQWFTGLWKRAEHRLTPGHIGTATIRGNGIDPKRVERMTFRGYQVPAAVTFFGTEEAFGVEARAAAHATELVPW